MLSKCLLHILYHTKHTLFIFLWEVFLYIHLANGLAKKVVWNVHCSLPSWFLLRYALKLF